MQYKLISISPTLFPLKSQTVVIIGSGGGAVFTALRFANLGFENVVMMSQRTMFNIKDCTSKVTQIHLSGLEYVGDTESAKGCLLGGLGFINSFGQEGWSKLVELGILESEGTQFRFTSETLRQERPTQEVVYHSLQELEAYYQVLKTTQFQHLTLPEKLFSDITEQKPPETFSEINVQSIQPGIQMMRLGALLQQRLLEKGVQTRYGETISTIHRDEDHQIWIINETLQAHAIINATLGGYQHIESLVNLPQKTPSMVKNNRYQLYVKASLTKESATNLAVQKLLKTPAYTLCTTNLSDKDKAFTGSMLDKTSFSKQEDDTLEGSFVLYSPGPQGSEKLGGGSWGTSFLPLDQLESWRDLPQANLEQIQTQVISSVTTQFPGLAQMQVRPIFIHNGYNLNASANEGRSDIRQMVPPSIVSKLPFFGTLLCLKFTHSAFLALQIVEMYLNAQKESGHISAEEHDAYVKQNQEFQVNLEGIDSRTLTGLTTDFCKQADVPVELAHFMSLPKNA